jgi:CRP-like cAMP-binding protein
MKTIIKALQKGDVFGQTAFFTGSKSEISARSSNVVQLAYVDFEKF